MLAYGLQKGVIMPNCFNCKYYRKSGNYASCECESEDCNWELKKPTLSEAMKIAECIDIDYGNADAHQIEEIDTALDVIFDFCKKALKENTAEWLPYIDGHYNRKTMGGICSNCGIAKTDMQTRYCPHCGRMMKGEYVTNAV